jgi:molecular chaperone HtpG
MIMEKCPDLVHEYFDFVKGVVDSPDLSLNISREILQHTRQLHVIGNSLEKKIKSELMKMMNDDRPKYQQFFRSFGVDIRAGICDEYGRYKDFLKDLLIFYTSEDHQVTLQEYVDNMPESQQKIYYASSDSVRHAMDLPQCEEVRARGYEIIYLDLAIDEMVLEQLRDHDGKTFCNVMTDDLGFDTEEDKKAAEEQNEENKELLDYLKESLGERVAKVRLTNKLVSKPSALSTEGPITLEMERYFRNSPSEEMQKLRASRVLEINANHHAFEAIKEAYEADDKEKAANYVKILAAAAELVSGVELQEPGEFVSLISDLL